MSRNSIPCFVAIFRYLVSIVLLLAVHRTQAGQLYIVSLKTGEIRQLTSDESLGFGCPDWSPDSQRIALDASPELMDYAQTQIMIVDCQGGKIQNLGPGAMPSWSPDGKRIVCHTFKQTGNVFPTANGTLQRAVATQIAVLDADGSGREVILEEWGAPRWSPDGRSFVSTYRQGLARFDFATGKQTVLLNNYGVFPGFSYSEVTHRFSVSSGFSLAIVEEEAATEEWLLRERYSKKPAERVQGTRPRNRENEIGRTSWAPDGQRIVFALGDPKTNRRLYILDADDTSPPTEVPGLPADWIGCNPSWSPDGEWIAFIGTEPDEPKKEKEKVIANERE